MNCPSCAHPNPDAARFCNACGVAFAARCPSCGGENPPASRFCNACGVSFTAPPTPEPAGARIVVTIIFADLVGSTAMHERLDAESVRRFMDRYYAAMRTAVETHGGRVTQLLGDGVMAVFGAPHVAEDDAIRAVRAAVAMQAAFRELAREHGAAVGTTGLRVAVNTGEVVANAGAEIIGDPVNVAARLQEEGRDGDVVIGEATRRLVAELVDLAPLGSFALKGRAERVAAYRVLSLERPAGTPATAFVGRDDELRRMTAVYDSAVAAPATHLAAILGSPGLGKSRLLHELGRRLGDRATVLTARLSAAGGATFAALAEALRGLLGLDDASRVDAARDASGDDPVRTAIEDLVGGDEAERARIAAGVAALIAGTPASPEETFFTVRRFLAALAAKQPVVLMLDDLQWAEPLLLDLTEHLVQWGAGVPLLVVVAARPELREIRSALATPGGLVTDVVTLGGLDAGAATRLAANVVGADELPAAVAGRVLATSEGNPLFVTELVRMLVHDGALKREGDRWTVGVELAGLEMPPTIHALLAARIERLPAEERLVLERASVVGRQFSRAAVAHLLPREVANLPSKLEALRRSELIEPDTGWLLGEPMLRFHHVLIRDAAYRRLLKETRAELHARFADWLEARIGETVEHDETIGWHLEQAHRLLRELGPLDDPGHAVGERAARYLGAAGRRALARDDVPLAASLLGRALARLDAEDPARADLALDWCEALLASGDVGPATGAIEELGRFIGESARLRAWHTCFSGQLAVLTDPQALHATAERVAEAAETLAAANDAAGEAKAHFVHAIALARLGKVGACEGALDRSLAAARRANDRRRANTVLASAPLAALWGPSPVTRASGRCLDVVRVLRITQGAPAVEAVALSCQAVLESLRGRSEAARRMIAASRRMVEELGIMQRVLEVDVFAGLIELLEGDPAAAERSLRAVYQGLRDHGLAIDAAQAAALLGRALLALGRADDAEAASRDSEALAGDDLKAAIAWRGVRAEALARRGEHAAAAELARAAVELAAATDAFLDHADARRALAAALRAAGRSSEAAAEETRAIELWEAKGATLLVERACREAGRPEQVDHGSDDRTPTPPARRLVRTNAAVANARSFEAAVAVRDGDAFPALIADDAVSIDHTTGAEVDRAVTVRYFRGLLDVEGFRFEYEPLATLGGTLALCRESVSGSGVAGRTFDFGAFENEKAVVIEVDAQGRRQRIDYFAANGLADAVIRLYTRYAELLPDGPARSRAAATARSLAEAMQGPLREFEGTALASDVEFVDHRTVGLGVVRGAESVRQAGRALWELMEEHAFRLDDVLALRSDALLTRWTHSGRDRAGGGAFERRLCWLWVFGDDGTITRFEQFDTDQEDAALARFDALTTVPPAVGAAPVPTRRVRRVRANAATANAARQDAAMAAGDVDAFPSLLADEVEIVDHPTGAVYDREGALTTYRALLKARDLVYRHEPIATLGESLVLCRLFISASGIARGKFDVGVYEREDRIVLVEVDTEGRRRRAEHFVADRLGDAVVRLYERYAELLPDGPERARAAATARSVAGIGEVDDRTANVERYRAAYAPGIEFLDHRPLGFPATSGADAFIELVRSLLDASAHIVMRIADVIAARPDALLIRWINSGTDRTSGGAYERHFLMLWTFGSDGLATRAEGFALDCEEEAVARLEELTAEAAARRTGLGAPGPGTQRRVRANAATATAVTRFRAALVARDADAIAHLHAEDAQVTLHPLGIVMDREETRAWWRLFFSDREPAFQLELVATLGASLALSRRSWSGSESSDTGFQVGSFEQDAFDLVEVDPEDRIARIDCFAIDRLGDAVVHLYERYADLLPDGPARDRAAATARSVAAMLNPKPLADSYRPALAPNVDFVDHRALGLPSDHGATAYLERFGTLFEVADDLVNYVDDVLALRPDAFLLRWTNVGTARTSGGAFERRFLILFVFGPDGLMTRNELFDVDCEVEALARFDELAAEPGAAGIAAPTRAAATRARRIRPNAATATAVRFGAALAARDADAIADLHAEGAQVTVHPLGVVMDREETRAWWRLFFSDREPAFQLEVVATLGASLALSRRSWSGSASGDPRFDVGSFERDGFDLSEVDAESRFARIDTFAVDHLGDAVARLYARHAELLPDGPVRARAAATARSVAAMSGQPTVDLERFGAAFGADIEAVDRRTLGTWSAHGAAALREQFRAMLELAIDVYWRDEDVLGLRSDALLVRRMHVGTDRTGGGVYERPFIMLMVFGPDGLLTNLEWFDTDRDAEALARFDELVAEPPATTTRKRERRLRPNVATASAARSDAAVAAHDEAAFLALFADGFEVVHHPTGAVWGRDGLRASVRPLWRAQDMTYRNEPLATLGEALALCRFRVWSSGLAGKDFDVGPYETEALNLLEVDAHGRQLRNEIYAADRLGDAVARLYERHAELLPDGPARERAATTARVVAAMMVRAIPFESDMVTPDFTAVDHRTVGYGTLAGAGEARRLVETWRELADDRTFRVDDVLALSPSALLRKSTQSGVWRDGGGRFERSVCMLSVFGPDGRATRFETFDADGEAEALARFDELVAEPTATAKPRIENAATRSMERLKAAWEADDWERFAATLAPGFRRIDRRTVVNVPTDLDRERFVEWLRASSDVGLSRFSFETIATRGERLMLGRGLLESADGVPGPSEVHYLFVQEVDDAGRFLTLVILDADDVDTAYDELDRRFFAGEAAAFAGHWQVYERFRRPVAAGDTTHWEAVLAPDFVVHDHSPLGWGTLGRAAYIESVKALVTLAPDARTRTDHLWLSGRVSLGIHLVLGTHQGGAFEQPRVTVHEMDAQWRERRRDIYTLDQLDEARARFAALGASVPRDPLAALVKPNAATATMDRLQAAFDARDWCALRGVCRADAVFEDRRRLALTSVSAERWIADLQESVTDDVRYERELVSTAGDRVQVERMLWIGGPPDGRYEVEHLWVIEVDEGGRLVAAVSIDPDDRRAAQREAWARWAAIDSMAATANRAVVEYVEAFNDHDPARIRGVLANDLLVYDHRRTGQGQIDGPDAFIETLRTLWEMVPDIQTEALANVVLEPYGAVRVGRLFGTLPEGGAFESLLVNVAIRVRDRITRFEFFEIENVAAALARFAELRPDPLRIPPNAATRAHDRLLEYEKADDWEAVRALAAPIAFEDRRPLLRVAGDVDMFVAHCRQIAWSRVRMSRTLLATAGDRLSLEHMHWTAAEGRSPFEIDLLVVHEVDAEGHIIAVIAFDPDDRRAASAELAARYARSADARWTPAARFEFADALRDFDLARTRAALPDDFVYDDHRRTGAGRVEGADAYIGWLASLFEQSSDAIMEPLYLVAAEKHGTLSVGHTFGTIEGGGPFESFWVNLSTFERGRFVGLELFEAEDLEVARARFEELRPDPLRIPPNAASRARDRVLELRAARDWTALRARASDDFVYEDRRKRALLTGDADMWVESVKFYAGLKFANELLATIGDRIALGRNVLTGETDGVAVEVEFLLLTVLDADGRYAAMILFDPDDRGAAFLEAAARFAAGEAAGCDGLFAFERAFARHDWDAFRDCFAPDVEIRDHRALGLFERLDRDRYIESLRILGDLASDVRAEPFRVVTWNAHGHVAMVRVLGTMRDGGPFENLLIRVIVTSGDGIRHFEMFALDEVERALARFEELCTELPSAAA